MFKMLSFDARLEWYGCISLLLCAAYVLMIFLSLPCVIFIGIMLAVEFIIVFVALLFVVLVTVSIVLVVSLLDVISDVCFDCKLYDVYVLLFVLDEVLCNDVNGTEKLYGL